MTDRPCKSLTRPRRKPRLAFGAVLLTFGWLAWAGCRGDRSSGSASNGLPDRLILATTTSLRDSGLLDRLVSCFEEQSGVWVEVVAVGSGQALELGRRGDADVLLVHSPEAEAQFIAEGYAPTRRVLMYNDFVLVGPPGDPAGVRAAASIEEALGRLAQARACFVSRGDGSGTHARELHLWAVAGIHPQPPWYIEAGAGMAEALRMASQKAAYTLADRATYLSLRQGLDLQVLFQGGPALRNQYSVIVPSGPNQSPERQRLGQRFADFLFSPPARRCIAEFGIDRFGQPLFFLEPLSEPTPPGNPAK